MRTLVWSKGQILLPAEIRRLDRIATGDEFDVERIHRGEYRLVRQGPAEPGRGGLAARLPNKGYSSPCRSRRTRVEVAGADAPEH